METNNGNVTILFVDDEDIVLEVGSLMLNKLGYDVLVASNGQEAIDICQNNIGNISLVILDMNLPDEYGSAICKKLKQINPNLNVIITSGLNESNVTDNFDNEKIEFLHKPFNLNELSVKLKESLKSAA